MSAHDTLACLARVVDAVRITSAEQLVFGGRMMDVRQGVPPSLYPTAHPLVTLLRDQLYEHMFIKPFGACAASAVPAPIAQFAQLLSQANAGCDRWDDGWRLRKVLPNGQVQAEKYAARRTLWPGEYVLRDGAAMALRMQAPLSVFQARESHSLQPGFYFAFGQTVADEQDEGLQLRFYWNVTAAGALRLLANLTRVLNRFGLPFKFKCLNAAEHYVRLDAAVLYVNRRFYRLVRELLGDIVAGLDERHLGHATPIFTQPVRPGVAVAEDPMGGESFGMNRCRIVAEGLWQAHCEQLTGTADRLTRVVAQFDAHGLSLQRPHLNARSTFDED